MGPLLSEFHKYGDTLPDRARLHRHLGRPARPQPPRRHRRRRAFVWAGIEQAARGLPDVGIPPEIGKILQGTLLLSAVIAFEVVRRYGQAAAVPGRGGQGRSARPRPSGSGRRRHDRRDRPQPRRRPKHVGLPGRQPSATSGRILFAVGGLAARSRSCASSPARDDLTAGNTFIAAIGCHVAHRVRRARWPLLRAGRRGQHRPRGHDDPRAPGSRAGPAGTGGRGPPSSPAPSAGRSAGCCWPSPRSPSASTTSWPASPSTSSRPASTRFLSSAALRRATRTAASRSPRRCPDDRSLHVPVPRRRPAVRLEDPGPARLAGQAGGGSSSPTWPGSPVASRPAWPSPPSSPWRSCRSPAYLLWRTPFGLRLRSIGEKPSAADSLGVGRLPDQVHRRHHLRRRWPASAAPGWPSTSGPTTRTRSPAAASRASPP